MHQGIDEPSCSPDSAIGNISPAYTLSSSSDDTFDLQVVLRDCQVGDGYVTRQALTDAMASYELSFQKEQLLIDIFEQLDKNDEGKVRVEQLTTAWFHEIETLQKRDMRKEMSPGALLMRQQASGGTPLFSYLLSSKDGLLRVNALQELWESQLNVDDPDVDPTVVRSFLGSLKEQTGGTVNASELAKNMEILLLEATENNAAAQTFRTLAVNAYKCEIDFLLNQAHILREERNKLRWDLSKLSDHRESLIRESEEHRDIMHHQHEAALIAQRKAYEEQLKVVQDEACSEQDRIVSQYNEQVKNLAALVDHLRQNETQLKAEIIDLKEENGSLEGELLDARAELNASNKMLDRLKSDLALAADCMPLDSDLSDSSDHNMGLSLIALREMNAQLKDKVDELTAETERLKQELRAEQRKSKRKSDSRNLSDDFGDEQSKSPNDTKKRPLNRRRAGNLNHSFSYMPSSRTLPDQKRPGVIGAERDGNLESSNLMLETMVIPKRMSTRSISFDELEALQTENDKLLDELKKADSKIAALTENEEALQSQVTKLESNGKQTQQQLQTTLTQFHNQIDFLVHGLTKTIEGKSIALNERVKQLAQVQEVIRTSMKVKEQDTATRYQGQVQELEQRLATMTDDHKKHTLASDRLKQKCRQLELIIQEEKVRYEKALKKMETLHENSVQSKDKAHAQLQEKHKRMVKEKDTEIRKLRQALGDNWVKQAKDLEQKHKRETGELKETILQLVGKQGEIEEETRNRHELIEEEHRREKEMLQSTIETLLEKNAALEASMKGAQAEVDEECRRQTAKLHNRIVELKEERAFLEGESQARAELEEHYRQKSGEMQQTACALEDEKKSLCTKIRQMEESHSQAVANLMKEVESVKSRLKEGDKVNKAKLLEMTRKQEETKRELAKLQKEKKVLEDKMKEKTHDLEQANRNHEEKLCGTIKQLQKQKEEIRSRCDNLEESYKGKEAELKAAIQGLKHTNGKLQGRVDWLAQVNKELECQNVELKNWDKTGKTTVDRRAGGLNLQSVHMKNINPPQSPNPPLASPPWKESATISAPVPIPEARKLTIRVTDTTAKDGTSAGQIICHGVKSRELDVVPHQPNRSSGVRLELLEKRLQQVQRENEHSKQGVTEEKAQLLKRIHRMRTALSQLVNDIDVSQEKSQASREQLEHAIVSLRAKVQKQEDVVSEMSAKLKCVSEENAAIKQLKENAEAVISDLQIQVQRLTRERDYLRKRLELSRKQTTSKVNLKTTATIAMNQIGHTSPQVSYGSVLIKVMFYLSMCRGLMLE
jgi:chromosome segregation ATPase